jgi:hypothetical protein
VKGGEANEDDTNALSDLCAWADENAAFLEG